MSEVNQPFGWIEEERARRWRKIGEMFAVLGSALVIVTLFIGLCWMVGAFQNVNLLP